MPYFLAFRVEVMVPVEIGLLSHRNAYFSLERNEEGLRLELDQLEEKWELANLRAAAYKLCSA